MARGGKRSGAGRKKQQRLVDASMADRILLKVKCEELWIEAIEKARSARSTHELRELLKYLTDRRDGRPVREIRMANPEGEKFKVEIDVTAARNRLLGMLTR